MPTMQFGMQVHGLETLGIHKMRHALKCGQSPLAVAAVQVSLYVHRNRSLIRDGNPGRPPRLSHNS